MIFMHNGYCIDSVSRNKFVFTFNFNVRCWKTKLSSKFIASDDSTGDAIWVAEKMCSSLHVTFLDRFADCSGTYADMINILPWNFFNLKSIGRAFRHKLFKTSFAI